jgi:hypothetical protein
MKNKKFLLAAGLLLVAAERIFYIIWSRGVLSADESVFGLMARHFMEGRDFSVFLWANHYAGTVTSVISAAVFSVFGVSGYAFMCVLLLWELAGIAVFSLLFPQRARWSVPLFFIFIPSRLFDVTFFTPQVELLFLSALSFLMIKLIAEGSGLKRHFFALGLVNGFGLYLHPQYLPYFFVTLLFALATGILKGGKDRITSEAGLILGLSPLIIYNIIHPFATIFRLGGRLIVHERAPQGGMLANFLVYGWPLALLFLAAAAYAFFAVKKDLTAKLMLGLFAVSAVFFFLPGLRTDRYMLPNFFACAGLSALAFDKLYSERKPLSFIFLALFIALGCAAAAPAFRVKIPEYQKLIAFLEANNIRYAASTYSTAYPVAFISNERIIVSPRLIDKQGFFDRYREYAGQVEAEPKKCLIFDSSSEQFKALYLKNLRARRVSFKETAVGGFSCVTYTEKAS